MAHTAKQNAVIADIIIRLSRVRLFCYRCYALKILVVALDTSTLDTSTMDTSTLDVTVSNDWTVYYTDNQPIRAAEFSYIDNGNFAFYNLI